MKLTKTLILVLIMLSFFSIKAFTQVTKQEIKSETGAPAAQDMMQNGRHEPSTEVKPESYESVHNHTMGVENRFVSTIGSDGVQHIEIIGGEYYFDPNYIVVKINTPVELKVKKATGYVAHDIEVKAPEAGIDFEVDLGKDWKSVTFTPSKVGKYEMICDKRFLWFKSHKDRGMDGYIEVVP
jgi:heme/copper-type cytochrome/quinol oxidase subunit 2